MEFGKSKDKSAAATAYKSFFSTPRLATVNKPDHSDFGAGPGRVLKQKSRLKKKKVGGDGGRGSEFVSNKVPPQSNEGKTLGLDIL